jgi:hypothetical protein
MSGAMVPSPGSLTALPHECVQVAKAARCTVVQMCGPGMYQAAPLGEGILLDDLHLRDLCMMDG